MALAIRPDSVLDGKSSWEKLSIAADHLTSFALQKGGELFLVVVSPQNLEEAKKMALNGASSFTITYGVSEFAIPVTCKIIQISTHLVGFGARMALFTGALYTIPMCYELGKLTEAKDPDAWARAQLVGKKTLLSTAKGVKMVALKIWDKVGGSLFKQSSAPILVDSPPLREKISNLYKGLKYTFNGARIAFDRQGGNKKALVAGLLVGGVIAPMALDGDSTYMAALAGITSGLAGVFFQKLKIQ